MAYFLFIDESGQDRTVSPYEVLAGVSVEDRDLWNLIQALKNAELLHFGRPYTGGGRELKAKKILKRKTFRQAKQFPPFSDDERRVLSANCLNAGSKAEGKEICALAQAKLSYVREVLQIASDFRCQAFASIVSAQAPYPAGDALRKDYAYLFERFFYFIEDRDPEVSGVIVFDELEKVKSHVLVGQMDRYFKKTFKGRQRARQIIPEPFFVHSELTTGIQLADLVAYVISWGFRLPQMSGPSRPELQEFVEAVCRLRYKAVRELEGNPNFGIWSFQYIEDLRGGDEKGPR